MTDSLVLSAGHQLRGLAATLADAVVACEFARRPGLRTRYGADGRTRAREIALSQLACLADAVDVDSTALFNDCVGWVKGLQHPGGFQDEDVDIQLACMADAVRQQMPPAVAAPAVAMIEGARAALPAMPGALASHLDAEPRLSSLAREYLHHLLGGYRQAAGQRVLDAAGRGEPVRELYLQVFQPTLREIGRLWQMNKISVAQEHFCSAATQILMAQLLARQPAATRRGHGAVVACVSGEQHELGARMVGDFLEMAGWDTAFCGASTPHEAVVQFALERKAAVLAVSVTMGYHLHEVQDLIDRVRANARCARLRVMVGGRPFNVDPVLWRAVGADGAAVDADAAVTLANQWVRPPAPQ